MEMKCECGDTSVRFYPDENQHEPACWECYFNWEEPEIEQKPLPFHIQVMALSPQHMDEPEIDDLPF